MIRLVMSAVVLASFGAATVIYDATAGLALGQATSRAAGDQLAASDSAYAGFQQLLASSRLINDALWAVPVVLLLLIWWRPLRDFSSALAKELGQ